METCPEEATMETGSVGIATTILVIGCWGCGEADFFEADADPEPVRVELNEPETGSSAEAAELPGGEELADGADTPGSGPASYGKAWDREAFPALPEEMRVPLRVIEARKEAIDQRETIAVVENIIDETVPHAMYVYVHDGGGTMTSFESVKPGEVEEFVPAPKEDPARFAEQKSEVLVDRLVDAGVNRSEAKRLVEERTERLFREHGRRVIYVAPGTWTEATGNQPLGFVESSDAP